MDATADALTSALLQFSEGHYVGSGGWLETANQRLPIRHVCRSSYKSDEVTPDQLAEVVVTMKDGKPIRMKDVADVVIGHQPMIGDGIINDGPGLLLHRREVSLGQHAASHSRKLKKRSPRMRPGLPGR